MSLLFSQEKGHVKLVFRGLVFEVRHSDFATVARSIWQTQQNGLRYTPIPAGRASDRDA